MDVVTELTEALGQDSVLVESKRALDPKGILNPELDV